MPQVLRPIVFLGPSIPVADAVKFLDADYRPPVRRGDLAGVARGAVVAIIDGVFDQTLAISPREIRTAIESGVRVFGSSSMGALRATEVPRMEGFGRVFAMFRDRLIDSDDEVALVFDAESQRPLSEPLVNVRFAVERLRAPGTIDDDTAARILRAAKKLFYPERSYPRILAEAGIRDRAVARQLTAMLGMHDLKRDDAISLLEHLRNVEPLAPPARSAPPAEEVSLPPPDQLSTVEAHAVMPSDAPVVCWEYGEAVPFRQLLLFLKMTGRFAEHAGAAALRYLLDGNELDEDEGASAWDPVPAVDRLVVGLRVQWCWATSEEARVTLRDLGVGFEDLLERMQEEASAQRKLKVLVREGSDDFLRALRSQLLMTDLTLKREAVRCGSLRLFSRRGAALGSPLRDVDLAAARASLSRCADAANWEVAKSELAEWGVTAEEAEEFARDLAYARLASTAVVQPPASRPRPRELRAKVARPTREEAALQLVLRKRHKLPGNARFCVSTRDALAATRRLCKVVGITRVALITGLSSMGLPNAQAYRPDGHFSSTIGSGKSFTTSGAKIGAVMEEVEKWAQEQFQGDPELWSSFEALQQQRRSPVLDPRLLDLPHDSMYDPALTIGWNRCHDLLSGALTYVPSAALMAGRIRNDIFWSPRLAQKMFTTNGLASAFTIEEALTHALSELVERDAQKLAELTISSPGMSGEHGYRFVRQDTLPASSQRLCRKIIKAGQHVEVMDITSDVKVPTFWAQILISTPTNDLTCTPRFGHAWRARPGYAAHPDPEVAVNMALLEAAQCVMTNIAGGREDLTIKTRSLGRHERSAAMSRAGLAFLRGQPDPDLKSFAKVSGFVSRDAREDVRFILGQIQRAGIGQVFAIDMTVPRIRPARVVRVIAPGLETPSSLASGPRARAALLRDLLPRTS